MALLVAKLLVLGTAASPVWAGSIAAWYTAYGPQVILLNDTTNEIRYSACNSRDEPRYSYTGDYSFDLGIKPKNGTPVTGVGWYDNGRTSASIWYLDEQNNVTNAYFDCNMRSGRFLSVGTWTVTSGALSVHPNSSLASVVLGEETGHRVYFHDRYGAINELLYTRATGWEYSGVISQDTNSLPALGAAFSGRENITVASARDEQNIATTRWNRDETWFRTTLPHPLEGGYATTETIRGDFVVDEATPANFSLTAWDGTTKSIGVSIDNAYTRFLWYIGNDRNLHLVANQNYTWGQRNNQSSTFWPLADEPNANLAVAYDMKTSRVWLYYTVQGQLSEIKFDNTWHTWSALQPPPPSTQSTSTNSNDTSDTGLSTGAKAGIGVGVSLGVIALAIIIAIVVLARRKKNALENPSDPEGSTTLGPDTPAPSYGSPALGYDAKEVPIQAYQLPSEQQAQQLDATTKAEMDNTARVELDNTARAELYAPPQTLYELPQHSYSHELLAEPTQHQPGQPPQKR
ncbi:hypothetical protein VTI28DRAFT_963 [Corynascus sepedonium]